MSSTAIINKLKAHIARYGIPDKFMSDNGPQFISKEFQHFKKEYGFEHITSSPHHHQSNGKVESAVKQAKRILKTATLSGSDPYMALLSIRNTPQGGFDSSPAERLMSRKTKTALPSTDHLLKPRVIVGVQERDKLKRKYDKGARDLQELDEEDQVRMQPFKLGDKEWKKGTVLKKVGIRSYAVESDGQVYVRNGRHLRPAEVSHSPHGQDLTPRDDAVDHTSDDAAAPPPAEEGADLKELDHPDSQHVTEAVRTRSGRLTRKPVYLKDFVE